jgi:DNA gyrase subunit A
VKKEKSEEQEVVIEKPIDEVIHNSMIPYTEYVVMDRALPRIEDGLKPVQRRILYSMLELGLTPDKQYRKSARIVGDCMGKYHPHGDSSVYDAMVRMAQNYSMRETLVDGHGNFGSVDGDSAAAMRYTEARLTPLSLELLKDLHKNTVSWSYNFDDTIKEPDMLPGKFPNLLVNGSTGIAVGVATNIPPHNLGEVIDGVCAYIKKPKIPISELMKYIKGPDFPTGALMIAGDGLKQAYKTGKGKIVLRAKIVIEKNDKKEGFFNLIITELPYQINKATLLQKIVELREAKKNEIAQLSYIGDILDESDRNGMRAIIKIKKGGNPSAILEYLYKNTQLETSFNINMVAIAGGKPKQMGLIEMVRYYVKYQREVLIRKSEFDLKNALDREHIVEGLLIAINQIDLIISLIKKSESVSEARQRIMEKIKLTQIQAQAILEIRLSRLVNLELLKLEQEYSELKKTIKNLKKLIGSEDLQYDFIISELNEIKERFSDKRRTKIIKLENGSDEKIDDDVKDRKRLTKSNKEKIKNIKTSTDVPISQAKHCIILVTAEKRLKKLLSSLLPEKKQNKQESIGSDDIYRNGIKIPENQNFLIFTNLGNCLRINADEIPSFQNGVSIHDLNNNIGYDEVPIKILPEFSALNETASENINEDFAQSESRFMQQTMSFNDDLRVQKENNDNFTFENIIILFTKAGLVKKMPVTELNVRKQYFKVIILKEQDEIINVQYQTNAENLLFITKHAFSLHVSSNSFPILKRTAGGLIAIKLEEDDAVIFAGQSDQQGSVTLISKHGFAKKVSIGDFEVMQKYRRGLKTFDFKIAGDFLSYANYETLPQDVAVKMKQNNKNYEIIKSQSIPETNRASKGKSLIKSEFIEIIPFRNL